MAHESAHEELLQALLAGDLAPGAASAKELLEDCAECALRWREMQTLASAIDDVDRERREVLRELPSRDPCPARERVAATLERAATRDVRRRRAGCPARASTWKIALLAAALLVNRFLRPAVRSCRTTAIARTRFSAPAISSSSRRSKKLAAGRTIHWRYPSGEDRGRFS
jgi:hypothetical protein